MVAEGDICLQLSRFVARLADKHTDPDVVFALRMAQTGLAALDQPPAPAPALAVIGPTQTGKSTVVNVIAGGDYVEVSPLAAHTRRAAVLAVNLDHDGRVAVSPFIGELAADCRPVSADGPPCLIWDTPDFDSNASAAYRHQVAQVCALVDLVVVVLSKEKYADQSVWTVLEGIAPLQIPAVV
ncbi:MAG: GTPase domain-containing protein, partial [Arenicellales bacterium]